MYISSSPAPLNRPRSWFATWGRTLCLPALSTVGALALASSTETQPPASPAACRCDANVQHTLAPEFTGPFARSQTIEVNRGHSPETFVRAAYWQVHGSEPSAALLADQANRLRTWGYWRRTDVINDIGGAGRPKAYSDPWVDQPDYTSAPCKVRARDVGAVMMFFFNCGEGPWFTNCGVDWANTHALGMASPHAFYGNGFYNPRNVTFWEKELMDARHAGLSFFLPNVYGPDITDGSVDRLRDALNNIAGTGIGDQVKIGMFDDTWGWGNLMTPVPNLANTVAASDQIFNQKWAPYFDRVPRQYWYMVGGNRPMIYFYNAGTLGWANSANVMARLKTLFRSRYGVTPWVVVDAYFFRDPNMVNVADSRFIWKTLDNGLPQNKSRSTMNGLTLDHAMVRWDDIRNNNIVATPAHEIHKGPELLEALMDNTLDADILVIATWNDLGEGTGINRNNDYYHAGAWLQPNHFMNVIRASQQADCVPSSCTFRNGSGVNPTGYGCVTEPALGKSWDATITLGPSTTHTVLGLAASPGQLMLPPFLGGGELLIGLVPAPLFLLAATPGVHSVPVPLSTSLLGGQLSTQGFRVDSRSGAPTLVMLNAQDLVIGSP